MKNYTHGRPPRYAGLWLLCVFHLLLSVTHAQTVTGTVSDEKGTKLSRASIMIKGSSLGTTTTTMANTTIAAPAAMAPSFLVR